MRLALFGGIFLMINNKRHIYTFLLWFTLATVGCLYFQVLPRLGFPSEDAAILYIYSEHAADTGAITYNAGEPPAEGATDFLWMVLLAGLYKAGIPTEAGAILLSALSVLGSMWVLRALFGTGGMAIAAGLGLLLLGLPPVFSAIQGFSPLFFGFFILLSFYLAVERRRGPMLISALVTCLIRPDGVVFMGPLLAAAFWLDRRRWRQNLLYGILLFALPGGAYFFWRMNYFGHLLPLPFYVKSNFERSALLFHGHSLMTNVKFILAGIPLIILTVYNLKGRPSSERKEMALYAAALVGIPFLFYSVMKLEQNIAYRFQYPFLIGIMALALLSMRARPRVKTFFIAGMATCLLLSPLYLLEALRVTETPQENIPYISKEMRTITPPGRLAITEAGRLPYYSGWPAVDLWGLNTPALARELVQPGFIRDEKPDVIVIHAEGDEYSFLDRTEFVPHTERSWSNMTDNVYSGIDLEQYKLLMVPHKREVNGTGPFIHLADTVIDLLNYHRKFPVYYLFAIRYDYAGYESVTGILKKHGAIEVDEYKKARNAFTTDPTEPENATNAVIQVYQEVLHRPPDTEAIATYVPYLQSGNDKDRLRNILMKSDERKVIEHQRKENVRAFVTTPLLCVLGAILFSIIAQNRTDSKAAAFVLTCCLIFPVLYYAAVWKHTINIPYFDDFDTILAFSTAPLMERVMNLCAQQNEHRILAIHLFTEGSRLFSGEVNFKTIAVTGNVCILGLFLLYGFIWNKQRLGTVFLAVISAVLFSFAAWTNMVWASSSTQNNAVHFFALLACTLFFYHSGMVGRVVALCAAMLALFSNANGMFVFPALFLVITLQRLTTRTSDREFFQPGVAAQMGLVGTAGILAGILYFAGYHTQPHHLNPVSGLEHPIVGVSFFLRFIGGYFILPDPGIAVAGGALLAALCVFVLLDRKTYQCPSLAAMLLYLMMTAVTVSLSRASLGPEAALYPRYRLNSILIICTTLALLLHNYPALQKSRAFLVGCAGLFSLFFIWHRVESTNLMTQHKEYLISKSIQWHASGTGLAYHHTMTEHAGKIYREAIEKGLYVVPEEVLTGGK